MSDTQQIVVHRSYTEEVIYNALKDDPIGLFQFIGVSIIYVLACFALFSFIQYQILKNGDKIFKNIDLRYIQIRKFANITATLITIIFAYFVFIYLTK